MIDQEIYDQACDWIVRLETGSATAEERAGFVRWLNRKPQHALAFEEMSQLWARMDTLGGSAEPVPAPVLAATGPSHRLGHWVAGSMMLILAICLFVVFVSPDAGSGGVRQFVTAMDTHHNVTAPDGSRLEMQPNTSLRLEYRHDVRHVLLEHGVVDFDVTRDERRPFVVEAGSSRVTVLGTRFRIDRQVERVHLQVLEGSVEFHPQAAQDAAVRVRVGGGQALTWHVEAERIEWAE
jgi:transmembrane sensor